MSSPELSETGLDNVFSFIAQDGSKRLATGNLVPGGELRIWDPYHSKLAALILKGSNIPIKKDSLVLYLGAANGTTVSHVSDIVSQGTVFAVEFSPRAMHDLIRVSAPRMNLIPILADAMYPDSYKNMVPEVDIIYQDVAQRDQAGIAIRNSQMFLKENGFLILIIKAMSIDSARKSNDVFNSEIKKLEGVFEVEKIINLEPFHSDHAAVVARKSKM
ncbi:MAG: fibrillarin-like rRNA/tRNA 2'-O-methyltransferase [Candidatus Methanoperedens sp.]|nr:fibrillarin-like rRNA/tRNA 2'-O-methyltransferase [Candidatus Methanoperedens sp.]